MLLLFLLIFSQLAYCFSTVLQLSNEKLGAKSSVHTVMNLQLQYFHIQFCNTTGILYKAFACDFICSKHSGYTLQT